jgi:transposase-like protein
MSSKGYCYPKSIILYISNLGLSYRDVEEIMKIRIVQFNK